MTPQQYLISIGHSEEYANTGGLDIYNKFYKTVTVYDISVIKLVNSWLTNHTESKLLAL